MTVLQQQPRTARSRFHILTFACVLHIQGVRCSVFLVESRKPSIFLHRPGNPGREAYHPNEICREIEQTQAASAARNTRRNMSYSATKPGRIISSSGVGKMKRNEQRLTGLEAIDKLRSKWKKVMMELRRELGVQEDVRIARKALYRLSTY